MGKKSFLAQKIDEAYNQGFLDGINKGIRIGIQFNNDIYQILLNSPEVVGKDVFGQKRLVKLHHAAEAMCEEYEPALFGVTNAEADVLQSKIDKRLKKIFGDMFTPFPQRYPDLVPCSYDGRKKK